MVEKQTSGGNLVRIAWFSVIATSVTLPLVFSPAARESFRIPKLALFHGIGFTLWGVFVAAIPCGWVDFRSLSRYRGALALTLAITAWSAITSAFSQSPITSWESFATVSSAVAFFLVTLVSAGERPLRDVVFLTGGGVLSAVLVFFQASLLWNPIPAPPGSRFALFGSPNDLAMFLVPVIVATLALALSTEGWLRVYGFSAFVAVAIGLLLTDSAAGVLSGIVGLVVMAAIRFELLQERKRAALLFVLFAVAALGAALVYSLPSLLTSLNGPELDNLLSGRLIAFSAAFEMVRDHPIVGVGPGMFEWHYFHYAPIADKVWGPFPIFSSRQMMFAEAHNDHLQIAAETGVPGLALFWTGLALLATRGLRSRKPWNTRKNFSRLCAAPLSASTFALSLAQFPFQLATTIFFLVVLSGLCIAWSSEP